MLQKDPEKFELWVIYGLDRKDPTNKGWPVKFTIIPGTLLVSESKIRRIMVRTTEAMWNKVESHEIPAKIKKKFWLEINE